MLFNKCACCLLGECPGKYPFSTLEIGGDTDNKKVLLVGNPNVGKSALFTRLTGVHAFSSNYPGTTVGFTEGYLRFEGVRYRLIDVPGAYTLEPTNEAEDVAKRILEEGADVVVITVDATALERNLNLALGQKRAEAVRRSLGLLGVSDNQIEAVSFGEEKPAVQGYGEDAYSKNRRAEISYR